ncbi:hypothetical protein FE257_009188 [Aspergillus nanangensis]|uniref:BTB domain-containing protein n=1 Tax=Aspergillus nanangensis TaxID=2582783 RepID=A0AAD4GU77_ASPNN|nr:hypothetical protein FE257_009188 [Aspergillus nanangensis]
MSSKLWEFFLRDDVESFQRFLATASYTSGGQRASGPGGASTFKTGSPGSLMTLSTGSSWKTKKLSGTSPGVPVADRGNAARAGRPLSREELNTRDQHGRTLLHLVASSSKPTAIDYALALLEAPFLDIYAQDWESGWTALHRALYAGNASIAQALLTRDLLGATDFTKSGNMTHPSGGLIKIKDRDGYSPFDVYGATIIPRDIKHIVDPTMEDKALMESLDNIDAASTVSSEAGDMDEDGNIARGTLKPRRNLLGDELFTFGSNKNLNLGVGNQDDRQYPERITLQRPDHLLQRFFREYQEQRTGNEPVLRLENDNMTDLPALIKSKPIKVQDMAMSKLHTAIITTDPESNLFVCGFGPGGRLGTGDESTRFSFVCIESGGLANKKIISVALGQDHTLAITEYGEIFSWGSNKFGQLGYNLPRSNSRDDVPIQTSPRQIFNPFKKEVILGAAASSIHSVVFSSSGIYTFGKNEGQLGIVDSDARSLEVQTTPRRVGASLFSAPIHSVTAIDQATAILLQNHEVWVFSQYGYSKLSFPLDVSSRFIRDSFMSTRYDTSTNRIVKVKSGGNAICAQSSFGEVFAVQVNRMENPPAQTSTTNPAKIRNSLSQPTRVWSLKKAHMAAKDFDVGQDGSIIICTASGSAWRKEKRHKSKDGPSKDYKFTRIPGLSRVIGVCSNAFGAYAAVQRDCNVTREQISVDQSTLWKDILPLSPFYQFISTSAGVDLEVTEDEFSLIEPAIAIRRAVMSSSDIDSFLEQVQFAGAKGAVSVTTTLSDIKIPVHEFILSGRSHILRKALHDMRQVGFSSILDVLTLRYHIDGQVTMEFQDVDILTVLNVVYFSYTDTVFNVWQQAKYTTESTSRYRQVRSEVMRVGTALGLSNLERAARLMIEPTKTLKTNMSHAITDSAFFDSADVIIDLKDDQMPAHSQVITQRCPFFNALFYGRSGGRWLSSRRTTSTGVIRVDLKHIDRRVFEFVLEYMYADTEDQLFDDVRSSSLEDFIDLILDVAFVANELMIDHLAQICQRVLGRFVNTRNVCLLLNSIAPCSVGEFKYAALEYICLNLEDLLANRLLTELDIHLMSELDAVCHENQMTGFPVSRGRNSEEYVLEKYPELVTMIEGDRRRRIDSMRLTSRLSGLDSPEARQRLTSNEKSASLSAKKTKAENTRDNGSFLQSPALRPKQSTGDMMFEMDDEHLLSPCETKGKAALRGVRPSIPSENGPAAESSALSSSITGGESFGGRSYLDDHMSSPQDTLLAQSPSELRAAALYKKSNGSIAPTSAQLPWSSSVISNSKKGLKDIMSETSESQVSNLSLGMSAARRESSSNVTPKLSQKERKKLQQQQMQDMLSSQQKAKEAVQNPWKLPTPSNTPTKPPTTPLKKTNGQGPDEPKSTPNIPNPKPAMTLRQTIAGTPPPQQIPAETPIQKPTRHVFGSKQTALWPTPGSSSSGGPPPSGTSPNPTANMKPAIQSVRHIPRPEPYQTSFNSPSSSSMSLAAILMQQQTEKDEIREAATAKHNLEEIQMEQQFQEWWDEESRRVQGLPDLDEPTTLSNKQGEKSSRGGRGGRGKGAGAGSGQHQPSQRKRRGKAPDNAPGVSALSQQLPRNGSETALSSKQHPTSRRDQPRAPLGPHVDGGGGSGHTRRGGGRGGGRGRGKG